MTKLQLATAQARLDVLERRAEGVTHRAEKERERKKRQKAAKKAAQLASSSSANGRQRTIRHRRRWSGSLDARRSSIASGRRLRPKMLWWDLWRAAT